MLRRLLLICALAAGVLAGCHGGGANPPIAQHHAVLPPRRGMTTGASQTYCEETQTPNPTANPAKTATYNCYVEPNSTTTVTGQAEPFQAAIAGYTCNDEIFSSYVFSGGPPQGLTVTGSGTEWS